MAIERSVGYVAGRGYDMPTSVRFYRDTARFLEVVTRLPISVTLSFTGASSGSVGGPPN